MKTLCAWCGVLLQDGPPEPVSHGICQPCFDAFVARLAAKPKTTIVRSHQRRLTLRGSMQ